MMRNLLLFTVLIPLYLAAQPRQNFILSEINFFKENEGYELNYSFRIPYERLVFGKNHNGYSTSFRLNIEVLDSTGKFLARGMTTKKVLALSYEETNSRSLFAEGLIKLPVNQTKVTIIPVFTDLETNQELKTPPVQTQNIEDQSDFISPIFIQHNKVECNSIERMRLVNYGGSVPFENNFFDLLIPVIDTSVSKLKCVLLNNADTVFNSFVGEGEISQLNIVECNNSIVLSDKGNRYKLFTIQKINLSLEEGSLTIFLSADDKFKKENIFRTHVKWYNKPFVLYNQQVASRVLKLIEDDDTISSLLRADEDKFINRLISVWSKYDPTEHTKFNELMEQFYRRVDYTLLNFSTISGKAGWDTDRGEVYIKFGAPEEIKRTSDDHGKIVETWFYNEADKQISFVDKTGTGEFVILSKK